MTTTISTDADTAAGGGAGGGVAAALAVAAAAAALRRRRVDGGRPKRGRNGSQLAQIYGKWLKPRPAQRLAQTPTNGS